ncbi:MAG: hypothetical protein ACI9MC_000066 [Kiritimatiellia bacterium]|jgi:hypothetical protein
MRWLSCVMVFGAVVSACGEKKMQVAPAVPAATVVEPVAPAPPPEPVVEEPSEPEPPASNADFQAELTMANGIKVSGHVVRVERGVDRYAEDGWTDAASKLTVELESGSDIMDADWDSLKSVSIRFKARGDVDCVYESDFSPWMYMCTMPTTSTALVADGKSWGITSRHKWRFSFDDGSTQEFYIYKIPVRGQDTVSAGLDTVENYELYAQLQADVMTLIKADVVTGIKISK